MYASTLSQSLKPHKNRTVFLKLNGLLKNKTLCFSGNRLAKQTCHALNVPVSVSAKPFYKFKVGWYLGFKLHERFDLLQLGELFRNRRERS